MNQASRLFSWTLMRSYRFWKARGWDIVGRIYFLCELPLYFPLHVSKGLSSRVSIFLFSFAPLLEVLTVGLSPEEPLSRTIDSFLFFSFTLSLTHSLSSGSRSHWEAYDTVTSFSLLSFSLSRLVCFVWCCHCGIKVLRLIIVCLFGTQQHLVWF